MLLLPKAPLDLHVAANLSENWRILNNFSQADFKFSHEPSLAACPEEVRLDRAKALVKLLLIQAGKKDLTVQ